MMQIECSIFRSTAFLAEFRVSGTGEMLAGVLD